MRSASPWGIGTPGSNCPTGLLTGEASGTHYVTGGCGLPWGQREGSVRGQEKVQEKSAMTLSLDRGPQSQHRAPTILLLGPWAQHQGPGKPQGREAGLTPQGNESPAGLQLG